MGERGGDAADQGDLAELLGLGASSGPALDGRLAPAPAAAPPPAVRAPTLRALCGRVLNSMVVTGIILLATFYVLFANDLRLLAFGPSADATFEGLSSACVFLFIVELLLRCWTETTWALVDVPAPAAGAAAGVVDAAWRSVCCGRRRRVRLRGYALSFLFLLDALAIVSLFPEIDWIWGSGGSAQSASLNTTRASRAARLGSRLGRIIRFVRVVRIFKLYGFWLRHPTGAAARARDPDADDVAVRESHISHRLGYSTARTVIILVLLTLLLTPLLSAAPGELGWELAAQLVHGVHVTQPAGWAAAVQAVAAQYALQSSAGVGGGWLPSDAGEPLLVRLALLPAVGLPPEVVSALVDDPGVYNGLRQGTWSELVQFSLADAESGRSTVLWFNQRPQQRFSSLLSICLTLIIVFLLLVGALQFSADAQALVLRPIETMLAFVERIATDPVSDVALPGTAAAGAAGARAGEATAERAYETKVLENTLRKIVGILKVGLGRSGMVVIARHLSGRRHHARHGDAAAASGGAALEHSAKWRQLNATRLTRPLTGPLTIGRLRAGWPAAHSIAPTRVALSTPAARTFAQEHTQKSLFSPFRPGRVVRVVIARIALPQFASVCEILGERVVGFHNMVAKIVHDTALAWDAVIVSCAGGVLECAWVIDDAWEELRSDGAAHVFVSRGRLDPHLQDAGGAADSAAASSQQLPARQMSARLVQRRGSLGAAIVGSPELQSALGTDGAGQIPAHSNSSNPVHDLMREALTAEMQQLRPQSTQAQPKAPAPLSGPLPNGLHGVDSAGQGLAVPQVVPFRGESSLGSMFLPAELEASDSSAEAPLRSGRGSTSVVRVKRHEAEWERARRLLIDKAREVGAKALASCLKIIAAVRRSRDLAKCAELPQLRARLRGYRPDVCVGLHVTWCGGEEGDSKFGELSDTCSPVFPVSLLQLFRAVESAYGSRHKVDPVYLSSQAWLPDLLQSVARSYGASVMLSGAMHRVLPPHVQECCRLVDRFQPHREPQSQKAAGFLDVFVYDAWDWRVAVPQVDSTTRTVPSFYHALPFSAFATALGKADIFNVDRRGLTEHDRCISLLGAAEIIEHPVQPASWAPETFDTDAELVALRSKLSTAARRAAESAVRAYLRGDLRLARELFDAAAEDRAPAASSGRGGAAAERRHLRLDAASQALLQALAALGETHRHRERTKVE